MGGVWTTGDRALGDFRRAYGTQRNEFGFEDSVSAGAAFLGSLHQTERLKVSLRLCKEQDGAVVLVYVAEGFRTRIVGATGRFSSTLNTIVMVLRTAAAASMGKIREFQSTG